jgi:hypothetical protein
MVAFSKVLLIISSVRLIIKDELFPYNPQPLKPGRKQKQIFMNLAQHAYCKVSPVSTYAQDSAVKFRLLPFRSPLLGESLLLSFPLGT